jgi:peptidyl-tRNA hydrolase, PTH1 family
MSPEPFKLIVGLGNPGEKYAGTRHNLGWMAVDRFAGDDPWKPNGRLQADLAKHGEQILAKPQTFMNRSGQAVKKLATFYQVPPAGLLVVSDDIDLPFGESRFRPSGGSGGHKGLQDIIEALGHQDFARLRLGVGRSDKPTDHVLSEFTDEEKSKLPEFIEGVFKEFEAPHG